MSLFVFQGCCNTYAQAANRRKRGKARYASSCSHRGAGSEEWHDMPRAAPQFKTPWSCSINPGPVHGHWASPYGMDQDKVLTCVQILSFGPFFPLFLSLSSFLSLLLLLLQMTNVCRPLVRLILDSRQKQIFAHKKENLLFWKYCHTTIITGPTCQIASLLPPPLTVPPAR